MCYFGFLGVEITPAKLPPPLRSADALWSAVSSVVARHHAGGMRSPDARENALALPGTSVVGALACAQCACTDRERLVAELGPLAEELLEAAEVRAVVLGYLWASGEATTELSATLDTLPRVAASSPERSFVLRVTRSEGAPWPTQTLAHAGRTERKRDRRRRR